MLYIDSADPDDVARLLATGIFEGITTNPTILKRAGLSTEDIPDVHAHARDQGARRIFLQAVGPDVNSLLNHAYSLHALGPDVIVKLPATPPGITASRRLTTDGIPILLTAAYHSWQGLLAHATGASWIAPYVGRISDLGGDGIAETIQLQEVLTFRRSECRVLAASIRDLAQLSALAAAGIDDMTLSADVCTHLLTSEPSVAAAAQFETDARVSAS